MNSEPTMPDSVLVLNNLESRGVEDVEVGVPRSHVRSYVEVHFHQGPRSAAARATTPNPNRQGATFPELAIPSGSRAGDGASLARDASTTRRSTGNTVLEHGWRDFEAFLGYGYRWRYYEQPITNGSCNAGVIVFRLLIILSTDQGEHYARSSSYFALSGFDPLASREEKRRCRRIALVAAVSSSILSGIR